MCTSHARRPASQTINFLDLDQLLDHPIFAPPQPFSLLSLAKLGTITQTSIVGPLDRMASPPSTVDHVAVPKVTAEGASSTFLSLPDELMLMVARFIPREDLLNLRSCSRRLEQATFDVFSTEFFSHRKVGLDQHSLPKLAELSKHQKLASKTVRLTVAKHTKHVKSPINHWVEYQDELFMAMDGNALLAEAPIDFPNLAWMKVTECLADSPCCSHRGNNKILALILATIERVGLRLRVLQCDAEITSEAFLMPYESPGCTSLASIQGLSLYQGFHDDSIQLELREDDRFFLSLLTELRWFRIKAVCDDVDGNFSLFLEWMIKGQILRGKDSRLSLLSWDEWPTYLPATRPPAFHNLTEISLESIDLKASAMIKLMECTPMLQTCLLREVGLETSPFTYDDTHYNEGTWHDMLLTLARHYQGPHSIITFVIAGLKRVSYDNRYLYDEDEQEPVEIWFANGNARIYSDSDTTATNVNSGDESSNVNTADLRLSKWFRGMADEAELR